MKSITAMANMTFALLILMLPVAIALGLSVLAYRYLTGVCAA